MDAVWRLHEAPWVLLRVCGPLSPLSPVTRKCVSLNPYLTSVSAQETQMNTCFFLHRRNEITPIYIWQSMCFSVSCYPHGPGMLLVFTRLLRLPQACCGYEEGSRWGEGPSGKGCWWEGQSIAVWRWCSASCIGTGCWGLTELFLRASSTAWDG